MGIHGNTIVNQETTDALVNISNLSENFKVLVQLYMLLKIKYILRENHMNQRCAYVIVKRN